VTGAYGFRTLEFAHLHGKSETGLPQTVSPLPLAFFASLARPHLKMGAGFFLGGEAGRPDKSEKIAGR
jgi:hypothetical protein